MLFTGRYSSLILQILMMALLQNSVAVDGPCSMPTDSGPCRMSLERYSYDAASKSCGPFIYGGCRGNANNFRTLIDCQDVCVVGDAVADVTLRGVQAN
ncbi:MAG: hypothetical protein MHMPM18_001719 [Marteilia pararefringens]